MSLSAPELSPRTTLRLLLTLAATVLMLVVLGPPLPAYALESRTFGNVVVERSQIEPVASTAIGDVRVDGIVERDVNVGFGDVVVNGEVGDDVHAGLGDVTVNGPINGSIDTGLGNVYVNAPVRGDVDVGRGNVELGPGALVLGDVTCGSGEIQPHPGAVVEGNLFTEMTPRIEDEEDRFGAPGLVGWVFAAVAFAACTVLASVLAPGLLLSAARRAEDYPGWSLLAGVASVPAVVVIAVMLGVSIVGIPLLLLLAPAYLMLVFIGALVAAYFVGRRVVFATGHYRAGNVLAAMVGAVILAAAYLIPVLGGLLVYGMALFGTGAAILALFSWRRPRAPYTSYEAYVQGRRE